MSPTSSSDNPNPDKPAGQTSTRDVKRPLWRRLLPVLLGIALLGGAVTGGVAWYQHKPGPTKEQRQAIAELRHEPVIQGLPGWTRLSYQEYARTWNGEPRLRVTWHSPYGTVRTSKMLIAKYSAKYGKPPGGDVSRWEPVVETASSLTIGLFGGDLDGAKGTDIDIDLLSSCACD